MEIKQILSDFFKDSRTFRVFPNKKSADYDIRDEKKEEKHYVSDNIEENLSYIKKVFSYPVNNDIVIRELVLKGEKRVFLVFIDGMVMGNSVDTSLIQTLQKLPFIENEEFEDDSADIMERFISNSQAQAVLDFDSVCEEINFGSCAVFVDGYKRVFIFDVRGWEHRTITRPQNEQSIYGPQEAFSEMLRTNTALIRKIIKTEKLIAEGIKVGNTSKTRGVLLYINDIANEQIVNEVKYRIKSISVDYIIAIEEVAQLIEEKPLMLTSQMLLTERPDRAAKALTQGRCVFLLSGSPRAIILPTNAFELTNVVSDDYLRTPFSNMSSVIRLFAMFMAILLPGLYLAITLHHQEIIPTYLLYSISASRENVPFPSIIELLLMDLAFEMIREAGIRMPSPIGSTLGIVGGLILGQAAVSAKIVSPIMIIVIAITGIGAFATADYYIEWTFRILRLGFIILGSLLGFYGIAVGIFLYSAYLGAQRSIGCEFLAPIPAYKAKSSAEILIRKTASSKELRPGFLYPKKIRRESRVSRNWKR